MNESMLYLESLIEYTHRLVIDLKNRIILSRNRIKATIGLLRLSNRFMSRIAGENIRRIHSIIRPASINVISDNGWTNTMNKIDEVMLKNALAKKL